MTWGGSRGGGRPPKPDGKSSHKSIRVSREVAEYLAESGTGIIESLIRRSEAFREWKKKNEPKA